MTKDMYIDVNMDVDTDMDAGIYRDTGRDMDMDIKKFILDIGGRSRVVVVTVVRKFGQRHVFGSKFA
jgi:hypothetical protein